MNKWMLNFVFVLFLVASFTANAEVNWERYYVIENVPIPKTIDPQLGGLVVLKNGNIAGAFHRGEVAIYDTKTKKWTVFAKGLHEPLGLLEASDGSLITMQKPELTKLIDTDNDGIADEYQTLSDQFGMSGNYHEFAFGPVQDSKGNLYFSLNVASNYAGIYEHIRGDFNTLGLSREAMTNWRNEQWKTDTKFKAGRMFSKVNYRGWVMQVSPSGQTTPFALGFRSPDGIFVDKQDRLWVTDNQGDWLGTSPLYQVNKGEFYGHPASLVWQDGWDKNPVDMSADELDALRTPASAWFPQAELANSPTQIISTVAANKFGLPENELLIGDMNQHRLIRFLEDKVDGFSQGTLIPFLDTPSLGIGNHRMSFDKKGQLWIGKTHLGWAGGEGIRKITWNKESLFLVNKVSQTKQGFMLQFNKAINEETLKVDIESHGYLYHGAYGSKKIDLTDIKASELTVSDDQKSVHILLPELKENTMYTIKLNSVKSETNQVLMGDILRYTLIKRVH